MKFNTSYIALLVSQKANQLSGGKEINQNNREIIVFVLFYGGKPVVERSQFSG